MQERVDGLKGSVFPRDLYVLFMDYLSPIDALRLSMTSRRLYSLFSAHERKYMQFDLAPRPLREPVSIVEAEWVQCGTCKAMLKKRHLTEHLLRNKCEKGAREDARHYDDNMVQVCTKCMTRVTLAKFERHLKRCNGRTDGWCVECGERHNQFPLCLFEDKLCRECCEERPKALFKRKKQCEGCTAQKWDAICYDCFTRCERCQIYTCKLCYLQIDPVKDEEHVCQAEIVQLVRKMNLEHGKIVPSGTNRYNVLRVCDPAVFASRDYSFYIASSFNAIEPFAGGSVYSEPCEVFVTSKFHAISFRSGGDFMWRVDKPPSHCAFCATTFGHMKQCGRCRTVRYCSDRCQYAHWDAHKIECLE